MKKGYLLFAVLLAGTIAGMAFRQGQPAPPDSAYFRQVLALDKLAAKEFDRGEYRRAIAYYDSALAILRVKLPEERVKIEELTYNKGHAYMELNDYQNSLKYFLETLDILEGVPDIEETYKAYNYQGIGVVYRCMGDYAKAGQYFDKALAARLEGFGEDHLDVAATYMVSGRLHKELGNLDKAMELLNKALDIRIRKGEEPTYIANTYTTIAITLGEMGEYRQAIDSLQWALAIQRKAFGEGHPHVGRTLSHIGQMYLLAGRYGEAARYLQQALAIQLERLGPVNVNTAHTYANMAITSFQGGQFDEALQRIDKALAGLNFTSMSRLNEVLTPYHVAVFLGYKARFYRKQSELQGTPGLLSASDSLYDMAIHVFQHLQKALDSDDSNVELIGKRYDIFEGAITTDYLLNKQGEAMGAAGQRAFLVSEQSKSFLLRQAYSGLTARRVYGVPNELLAQEKQLRARLAQEEKDIYVATQKPQFDSALVKKRRDTLFQLAREYDRFLEKMKTQYPRYHKLKYNNTVLGVSEVQKQILAPGQALVEYFVGDSTIFIFVIQPDDFHLIRLANDFEMDKLVRRMRDGIYNAILGEQSHYDSLNRQYVQSAHELYQRLVLPFDTLLEAEAEIIIIPDGALGLLPFEALLVEPAEEEDDFRNHHYLLKNHPLSYAFSATLLGELQSIEHAEAPKGDVLFVAPSYARRAGAPQPNRRGAKLLQNTVELRAIRGAFVVDSLINGQATKEAFKQSAHHYRILHLATHGQADVKVGDYSSLAFHASDSSIEVEKLFAGELYNLQLNADLVVLSACETGLGEWRRGEGIISLARAFSYAGAKSIVSSLWKVEDASTSQLMAAFYKNLKSGMAKSQALRQAKLEYFAHSPNVEPFYWAGFIPTGDMAPIHPAGMGHNYWYFILALLGGVALAVLLIRKRSNTHS